MKTTLPLLVFVLLGGLVRADDAANLTRTTWIDPATNLMWAKQDSRSDLTACGRG